MDLTFGKEELAFQQEVRDWLKENLTPEILGEIKVGRNAYMPKERLIDWQKRLAKKGWLHASLTLGEPNEEGFGMYGSGVFVINPPYTLHATLETALPWLRGALGQSERARYLLEHRAV